MKQKLVLMKPFNVIGFMSFGIAMGILIGAVFRNYHPSNILLGVLFFFILGLAFNYNKIMPVVKLKDEK